MTTMNSAQLVAGISKPIATAEELEMARKGNRFVVKAIDKGDMLRSIPNAFAKKFSGRLRDVLKAQKGLQEHPYTLMHKEEPVRFVVQWMTSGGMDATGPDALLYPKGNVKHLQSLQKLAEFLKIDMLLERVEADIKALREGPVAKQKPKNIKNGVPQNPKRNQKCFNCNDPRHIQLRCPLLPFQQVGDGGWWKYDPANVKPEPFHAVKEPRAIVTNGDAKLEAQPQPENDLPSDGAKENIVDKAGAGPMISRAAEDIEEPKKTIQETETVAEELKVTEIKHLSFLGTSFVIHDQDDNQWIFPRTKIALTVEGIGADGQLKFSGSAPFEYSWYPLDEQKKAEMEAAPVGLANGPVKVAATNGVLQSTVKAKNIMPHQETAQGPGLNVASGPGKANTGKKPRRSKKAPKKTPQ
ncbi:uncharacterized protein KY384_000895 [Bacidia gigantensis]|uniref:uncharacterized protein n=1 Tax=Bacidia gigantensis TaxID=2732470 RepID=UPI001D04790A|nr:uncharacterized protein KY384_000895 [Bacidia gigantensis]KAG8534052.1 hypothetical protein KY384_000895 [Bacidia gigantensis]